MLARTALVQVAEAAVRTAAEAVLGGAELSAASAALLTPVLRSRGLWRARVETIVSFVS